MNLDLEKSTNIFIKILYHFTVIILDVWGKINHSTSQVWVTLIVKLVSVTYLYT